MFKEISLSQIKRAHVYSDAVGSNAEPEYIGRLMDVEASIEGVGWGLSHFLVRPRIGGSHDDEYYKFPVQSCLELEPSRRRLLLRNLSQLSYCDTNGNGGHQTRQLLSLCGYTVHCHNDEFLGIVEDLRVDLDNWSLKSLVVEDFSAALMRAPLHIPISWVLSVNHQEQDLRLWLSRQELERSLQGAMPLGSVSLFEPASSVGAAIFSRT